MNFWPKLILRRAALLVLLFGQGFVVSRLHNFAQARLVKLVDFHWCWAAQLCENFIGVLGCLRNLFINTFTYPRLSGLERVKINRFVDK